MSCNTQRARLLIKRGSGKPTIPTSPDHTDGTWLVTDIYIGEQYMDTDTGIIYTRTLDDEITQCTNGLIGVFKANLTSADAINPPVINAIQIDTIGFIDVTRSTDGVYLLNFEDNSFIDEFYVNVQITNSGMQINQGFIGSQRAAHNIISINTYDSTVNPTDLILNKASISIEVYAPQIIS